MEGEIKIIIIPSSKTLPLLLLFLLQLSSIHAFFERAAHVRQPATRRAESSTSASQPQGGLTDKRERKRGKKKRGKGREKEEGTLPFNDREQEARTTRPGFTEPRQTTEQHVRLEGRKEGRGEGCGKRMRERAVAKIRKID